VTACNGGIATDTQLNGVRVKLDSGCVKPHEPNTRVGFRDFAPNERDSCGIGSSGWLGLRSRARRSRTHGEHTAATIVEERERHAPGPCTGRGHFDFLGPARSETCWAASHGRVNGVVSHDLVDY
jgi:hypothetical protein